MVFSWYNGLDVWSVVVFYGQCSANCIEGEYKLFYLPVMIIHIIDNEPGSRYRTYFMTSCHHNTFNRGRHNHCTMGMIIQAWELDIHIGKINIYIMFLQPGYSKNELIMANGSNIVSQLFMIVANSVVNVDIFRNITGGDWSSINNIKNVCSF
jgi:hypothetical protein